MYRPIKTHVGKLGYPKIIWIEWEIIDHSQQGWYSHGNGGVSAHE